jgi:hypothetical protein
MATDVNVQYFSHLNGLTLGNNWGDLIRLLDKALVTGLDFTQVTAASIDAQGDVHITLYAVHNAMLFQVVELSGFTPASLNQKYRIKGVSNTTQLILKPETGIVERSITAVGSGKLASLGYEIVFRDANDVKRVYRAKNPAAQHPFIRVDETISDGVNSYNSAYAKYAMVGLLEHMEHIDDYENPDVLQLPFDPNDPAKNWRIKGTGASVVRGWSRWHWARGGASTTQGNISDEGEPDAGQRPFTLVGDRDAFWFLRSLISSSLAPQQKLLSGCGIFDDALKENNIPDWFLSTILTNNTANTASNIALSNGGGALASDILNRSALFVAKQNAVNKLSAHVDAYPIVPDSNSGLSGLFAASDVSALQIPIYDQNSYLRGTLKHASYSGHIFSFTTTTPLIAGGVMYIADRAITNNGHGGFYFYLGELE